MNETTEFQQEKQVTTQEQEEKKEYELPPIGIASSRIGTEANTYVDSREFFENLGCKIQDTTKPEEFLIHMPKGWRREQPDHTTSIIYDETGKKVAYQRHVTGEPVTLNAYLDK